MVAKSLTGTDETKNSQSAIENTEKTRPRSEEEMQQEDKN
jgi:hypothetical protein